MTVKDEQNAKDKYHQINTDKLKMNQRAVTLGWRGGLVVGRRTCDLVVAGSRPGRDAAAQQP